MVSYVRTVVLALCGLLIGSFAQEEQIGSSPPGNAKYDYVGM